MASISSEETGLAPITSSERIGELDVLRGFALLAVFVVHFVGAAYYDLPLDEVVAKRWASDPIQATALFGSNWLLESKGNTLFATLFGMGFWVMMERLEARGTHFGRIYLRRLAALFVIGLAHLLLIFPMDVLHAYAMLGLALYLLRWLPARAMLLLGLVLAVFGEFLGEQIADMLVTSQSPESQFAAIFESGDYGRWALWWPEWHFHREIVRGGLLGWALYLFGRFLIGAWIIRVGLIQKARTNLPLVRKICLVALPVGMAIELLSLLMWMELLPTAPYADNFMQKFGTPIFALGYATGLILLYHSRGRPISDFFAPVGRTALTAYVIHGVAWTLLLFPLGLGLQGQVSPAGWMAISIGLFAACSVFGSWWLARYRYGPLEYLWRWATYGSRPKFRLQPAAA